MSDAYAVKPELLSKILDSGKLMIPELCVLVLSKRHVGSGNEIGPGTGLRDTQKVTCHVSTLSRRKRDCFAGY